MSGVPFCTYPGYSKLKSRPYNMCASSSDMVESTHSFTFPGGFFAMAGGYWPVPTESSTSRTSAGFVSVITLSAGERGVDLRSCSKQFTSKAQMLLSVIIALLGTLSVATGFVVTSDDSGQYLAAVDQKKGIFISSDYGASWVQNQAYPTQAWTDLSSDQTGMKLSMSSSCSNDKCAFPFLSADGGATWTESGTGFVTSCKYVVSDGSGQKLALSAKDDIYLSEDGGNTWKPVHLKPFPYPEPIAYSADGSTLIYSYNTYISVAKDGKWLGPTSSPAAYWYKVSTSGDGTVIAGTYNSPTSSSQPAKGVYASFNGGASYVALATTYYGGYNAVEVTDDGSLVYYGGYDGLSVYDVAKNTTTRSDIPIDSEHNTYAIFDIATSSDGKYAVASSSYPYVWTSSNYGVNWTLVLSK